MSFVDAFTAGNFRGLSQTAFSRVNGPLYGAGEEMSTSSSPPGERTAISNFDCSAFPTSPSGQSRAAENTIVDARTSGEATTPQALFNQKADDEGEEQDRRFEEAGDGEW